MLTSNVPTVYLERNYRYVAFSKPKSTTNYIMHGVIDCAHAWSILHKLWLFTVRACARPIQLYNG